MRRLATLALLSLQACGPATPIITRAAQVAVDTAVANPPAVPEPTPAPMKEPEPLAVQPDGSSVDAIVTGLYASVSHGPEYAPNWERLRRLFLPGARIVPPKRPDPEPIAVLGIEAFEERIRGYIAGRKAKGESLGFTEREIWRRADCFGNICQVFSAYEILRAPRDPAPFGRGVHSLQLVNDGRRWWITALVWDTERPDNPIPPS
jgi:hypothetical protein